MKFARLTLCALAAVALISGCGNSSDPTRVMTEDDTPPSLDTAPPPAPSGVSVMDDPISGRSTVVWSPSSASDIAGYQIFVYDPDPERESSYILLYATDATTSSYMVNPSAHYDTKYFRVRAVDASGNLSAMSSALTVNVGPVVPSTSGGGPEGPTFPTMEP